MWFNTMFPFVNWGTVTSKKLALFENQLEFQNVFCNYLNLALDKFHFEGLPDTCNERFFKIVLICTGKAALIWDEEKGFITLGYSYVGNEYNIYGETDRICAYGWNGYNKEYSNYMWGSDNTGVKAVACRDNPLVYPLVNYIITGAERLCNAMRTADVTARKLKTPYFITCDESQKSTVKSILKDIEFNEDSIITNKSTTPNMFQVLPTEIREGALTSLWEHYYNLQAETRNFIGIPGIPNRTKKERLITSEASADDNLASSNLAYRMHSYEDWCETVNKHFGLNIKVVFDSGTEYVVDTELDAGGDSEISDDSGVGEEELS